MEERSGVISMQLMPWLKWLVALIFGVVILTLGYMWGTGGRSVVEEEETEEVAETEVTEDTTAKYFEDDVIKILIPANLVAITSKYIASSAGAQLNITYGEKQNGTINIFPHAEIEFTYGMQGVPGDGLKLSEEAASTRKKLGCIGDENEEIIFTKNVNNLDIARFECRGMGSIHKYAFATDGKYFNAWVVYTETTSLLKKLSAEETETAFEAIVDSLQFKEFDAGATQ